MHVYMIEGKNSGEREGGRSWGERQRQTDRPVNPTQDLHTPQSPFSHLSAPQDSGHLRAYARCIFRPACISRPVAGHVASTAEVQYAADYATRLGRQQYYCNALLCSRCSGFKSKLYQLPTG